MSSNLGFVENIKSAVFSANLDNNSENVLKWINECNRGLRTLKLLLSKASSTAEKQKIITAIGQVKSFREKFRTFKIVGKGHSPRKQTATKNVKWEDVQSAFEKRIRTGVIINLRHTDPTSFMKDCGAIFCRRVKNMLKDDEAFKINTTFCGYFKKVRGGQEECEIKYMNTKNMPIYRDSNLLEWFKSNVQTPILTQLEEFQEKDSGWALISIINLQVNVNKYTLLLGSSYIELPKQIKIKHACVNVKNEDNACFAWAVTSALHPAKKNADRTASYPHYTAACNLTGIQFPMTLKQIPRFEAQNYVSINVYILKKNKEIFNVLPVYLTKAKQSKHINLLMIQDEYWNEDDESNSDMTGVVNYHFVWIKNLSRLVSTQLSKYHCKKYFCDRCLHYFYSQTRLEEHYENCIKMNDCKIRLPQPGEAIVKFKNHKNKIKNPFTIYVDLECLLEPCDKKNIYQDHKPCSIGYYVKCSYDPTLSFYKSYRGEDCIIWFTEELKQFSEDVETVFLCPIPMDKLTPDQEYKFRKTKICYVCEKPFQAGEIKVRDHCHLTGAFRNAAHQECNINYQDSYTIPVVLHNLSGYDSHFIIKNLANDLPGRVDLLPVNKERYISFTKHLEDNIIKFRFIDSFRFMASSLDKLASYLTEFPNLKSQFPNLPEEKLNLLTRKGVYPYDYFTCFSKFSETALPFKSQFYNKLNDAEISDDDYVHAQNIWVKFEINNLGEYSDLYLKTDVLLLADVFEKFRCNGLTTYGLDPAHYYTLPGYTWDCMLKHTDIELELLTDIDMIMFMERGIRGGLSQCSKRYAKANNKYLSNFDVAQPSTYLIYNDINNQYGWAMSQNLPTGGFAWLNKDEIENFNVNIISDEASVGYILEVNVQYSTDLHDAHADLPFCPEHQNPPNSKDKKLLATLYDKECYVIHYRNLKQILKHGLKLTKIHRVLKFNQSPWLKPYIDLNTELRKKAKNEFEKNQYKLMNNAVFGKTMENVRNHCNIKLVTKWEGRYGAEAMISKPEFKASTIFNENLVAIELHKTEIYFNKPIYVGMCILDISKTKIYEFHYEYMKPKFGNNCKVLYTDTDSLIYEIIYPDIYDIIRRDCHEYFDTSDYPADNVYNIPLVNKKVLGLMKDEMNGAIMTEFVGLRSKMYAVRVNGEDKIKKSKGVKGHVVKNQITFDDYVECLNTNMEKKTNQNLIRSDKHNVSTVSQAKIALSPHDDKRYLINDSYETLPWGHYSIIVE